MREHLFNECHEMRQLDTILFERLSQLSTRGKPSLQRHRWELMHFKEIATSAGNTDTLRKNVAVRATEGQRSFNVHNVERNATDSVGYGATHHPTKMHRKEDGKETEKETTREPRKAESSKGGRGVSHGKGKTLRKERTTSQRNHRTTRGTVDMWILGTKVRTNLGAQKPALRVGVTMIGTLQIRILRLQQQPKEFQRASIEVICDCRIWAMSNPLKLFSMIDWILHSELSHLVSIPLHAKQLFLQTNLQHVDMWSTKIRLLGCAYSTAGRDKVYDRGKRILCPIRWNRKTNCHGEQKNQLPTTLDDGHRDDRL